MSDLTDNEFYPSTERIWLWIRLNNAGKYRMWMCAKEAPSAPYVRYLVEKVKETGILIDKPKREKAKTVRKPENIAAVAEIGCETPPTSIHRRSEQLNILETSLIRILHKDLGMTPYKVQLVQELKRFRFAKCFCDRLT